MSPFGRESSTWHPPDWPRTRRAVLDRDGHRCTHRSFDDERCPVTTGLHVDRVIPFAEGGSSTPDNCATLCARHHAEKWGAEGNRAMRRRLVRDAPAHPFHGRRERRDGTR